MNDKLIDLLKSKSYVVPDYILKNYKKLGLTSDILIVFIYLINLSTPIVCDYSKISMDLNMDIKEVMGIINELIEKKLIQVELKKNSSSKLEEYINLDLFYNKLFLQMIDNVEEVVDNNNIYSMFERELGRSLSPIEYELINGWLECNYKEDIILAALKEAVFSGVNNFRYIDRILFEWNKKGIDTVDKIEKNKLNYMKKDEKSVVVPDYDWLNQDE